ncbi:MAG: hypothetical protein CM1200mP14_25860 [Gammaproteobacteria bacterium]|nr:MAG: hypothetical protein CM1200mP14_25860 [Gammaproteobacteria bacterium]
MADALVARRYPVTGGFTQTQLSNIGSLDAWGMELNLRGSLIQNESVSLNVFANGAFLNEKVSDMGGAPPLKTGNTYPRYRNTSCRAMLQHRSSVLRLLMYDSLNMTALHRAVSGRGARVLQRPC